MILCPETARRRLARLQSTPPLCLRLASAALALVRLALRLARAASGVPGAIQVLGLSRRLSSRLTPRLAIGAIL